MRCKCCGTLKLLVSVMNWESLCRTCLAWYGEILKELDERHKRPTT